MSIVVDIAEVKNLQKSSKKLMEENLEGQLIKKLPTLYKIGRKKLKSFAQASNLKKCAKQELFKYI